MSCVSLKYPDFKEFQWKIVDLEFTQIRVQSCKTSGKEGKKVPFSATPL